MKMVYKLLVSVSLVLFSLIKNNPAQFNCVTNCRAFSG